MGRINTFVPQDMKTQLLIKKSSHTKPLEEGRSCKKIFFRVIISGKNYLIVSEFHRRSQVAENIMTNRLNTSVS